FNHIRIKGLMTMPPFFDDPERARPYFAALRGFRDQIAAKKIAGLELNELSMGMSGDFETAIEEGATLVRIGTALFGERQ
ncbi:MAG: alanine racemase, partial [Desulfobacteraceae bacterium]|nr:alanine racemase [Desulfobacteraceae bacterium]